MLKPVTAAEASRLVREAGASLIDIREPDEHARERIPGARSLPLSRLAELEEGGAVIFHCRSGARSTAHAAELARCAGPREAMALAGGIEAWKRAGLPVATDRRQPIEVMRQVQIAAESLVLLGLALVAAVSPWFLALTAAIGAGLVFAGVSGSCGLAVLLRQMPWNRAGREGIVSPHTPA